MMMHKCTSLDTKGFVVQQGSSCEQMDMLIPVQLLHTGLVMRGFHKVGHLLGDSLPHTLNLQTLFQDSTPVI